MVVVLSPKIFNGVALFPTTFIAVGISFNPKKLEEIVHILCHHFEPLHNVDVVNLVCMDFAK